MLNCSAKTLLTLQIHITFVWQYNINYALNKHKNKSLGDRENGHFVLKTEKTKLSISSLYAKQVTVIQIKVILEPNSLAPQDYH